jgi:hypothetical protein
MNYQKEVPNLSVTKNEDANSGKWIFSYLHYGGYPPSPS